MRSSYFDYEGLRSVAVMQERYFAQRRRDAAHAGGMINNVVDADALEYGDGGASGLRYTNPGRLSRLRGGW
jgi:hypothetical protein